MARSAVNGYGYEGPGDCSGQPTRSARGHGRGLRPRRRQHRRWGAWVVGGTGVAHFLFEDGAAARAALEGAGIRVLEERDVLVQRLKQDVPGQLGLLTRRMAEAGVNIEVLYSDHNHQLILVVDDVARGRQISEKWGRESQS